MIYKILKFLVLFSSGLTFFIVYDIIACGPKNGGEKEIHSFQCNDAGKRYSTLEDLCSPRKSSKNLLRISINC